VALHTTMEARERSKQSRNGSVPSGASMTDAVQTLSLPISIRREDTVLYSSKVQWCEDRLVNIVSFWPPGCVWTEPWLAQQWYCCTRVGNRYATCQASNMSAEFTSVRERETRRRWSHGCAWTRTGSASEYISRSFTSFENRRPNRR
jgi:hypothetical protein